MDVIALAQAGSATRWPPSAPRPARSTWSASSACTRGGVLLRRRRSAGRKAADAGPAQRPADHGDGRQARFLFLREGEDPDTLVRREGRRPSSTWSRPRSRWRSFCSPARPRAWTWPPWKAGPACPSAPAPDPRAAGGRVPRAHVPGPGRAHGPGAREPDAPRGAAGTASRGRRMAPADLEPPPPTTMTPPSPPDDEEVPCASAAPGAPRGGHATLPQAAIALLLHKPEVAPRRSAAASRSCRAARARLLRDILELLHKRPESSTGMLLGHWHGTDEGELLAHLAGQERLIPRRPSRQQFGDILRASPACPCASASRGDRGAQEPRLRAAHGR
jgi:DNA primase